MKRKFEIGDKVIIEDGSSFFTMKGGNKNIVKIVGHRPTLVNRNSFLVECSNCPISIWYLEVNLIIANEYLYNTDFQDKIRDRLGVKI